MFKSRKSTFAVDRAHLAQWVLLQRIDAKTLKLVKFFVPHIKQLFAVLYDGRFIAIGDNAEGLLGLGHKRPVMKFEEIIELQGKSIKEIACGHRHVLVLTKCGQVWGWGWNFWGQVGAGHEKEYLQPQLILEGQVKAIRAGCSHSLALMKEGKVLGWGWNQYGAIGVASTVGQPKPVPMFLRADEKIKFIEAGPNSSVAVSATGKVYFCGWNGFVDGNFRSSDIHLSPILINVDNKDIKAVACSSLNVLFLTKDGLLYIVGGKSLIPKRLKLVGDEPAHRVLSLSTKIAFLINTKRPNFLIWTKSGRMFYCGDISTGTQYDPIETKASLNDFLVKMPPFQYFPRKLHVTESTTSSVDAIEEFPPPPPPVHPLLAQLFQTSSHYDIEFAFDDNQTIKVHRNILCTTSEHMLQHLPSASVSANRVTRISPQDFAYPTYYYYLAHLYSVPLPDIALDELGPLLRLAATKGEDTLKLECVRHLIAMISVDNCSRIHDLAVELKVDQLEKAAVKFMNDNKQVFMATNGYKRMKTKPF